MNDRKRVVGFVDYDREKETFKYKFTQKLLNYGSKLSNLKRYFNTLWTTIRQYSRIVNVPATIHDITVWLIEAMIEGLIVNFAIHTLFNLEFDILTILAYGILIKKIPEIIKDILSPAQNVANPEIPKIPTSGQSKS